MCFCIDGAEDELSRTEEEEFLKKFRQELTDYYIDDYCHIMKDPWEEGDAAEINLDEYFVRLSLWKEENGSDVEKIPLGRSQNQLFEPEIGDEKPKRLLIFGEGGTGKSTLCKKLAYDWAKRDPKSPLKDIPILCVVEFRKLQESDSIADAIHSQLLRRDCGITSDEIRQFLISCPSQVILVLDGYDEFDPSSYKGDINDLLSSRFLANVITLVTTRPFPGCLLQKKKQRYVQIYLEGFDETGVEHYVHQYFKNPDVSSQCLTKIHTTGILQQFAKTPILLLMICFMHQMGFDDDNEINTLNALFENFLRALFTNYRNKQNQTHGAFDMLDTEALEDFWDDLGKLALRGVLIPGKKVIFSRNDFHGLEGVCELGIKVGVLIRHTLPMRKRRAFESPVAFSFPHLLLQEKCAGDYLAGHYDVMDSTLNDLPDEGRTLYLQYTLSFCCGRKAHEEKNENRVRAKRIVSHILKLQDIGEVDHYFHGNEDELDLTQETFAVRSHFLERRLFMFSLMINHESQSDDELLSDIVKLDCPGRNFPDSQHYVGILYESFQYFLQSAHANANENISLHGCSVLTLSRHNGKISLFEVLTWISRVVKTVGCVICYSEVDSNVNTTQLETIKNLKQSGSAIFGLQVVSHFHEYPAYPLDVNALFRMIGLLDFDLKHVELRGIITFSPTESHTNVSFRETRLEMFFMSKIENTVSLETCLKVVAKYCPAVTTCAFDGTQLSVPAYEVTRNTICPFVTNIEDLKIGVSDMSFSLLDFLGLTAVLCPRLKICKIHPITPSNVPDHHDVSNAVFSAKSSLEELCIRSVEIGYSSHTPGSEQTSQKFCQMSIRNLRELLGVMCPFLIKCTLDGTEIDLHRD